MVLNYALSQFSDYLPHLEPSQRLFSEWTFVSVETSFVPPAPSPLSGPQCLLEGMDCEQP